jgi:quinol monooxygenase YgiN
MSVHIIVDMNVKSGSLDQMTAFMRDNLGDTRAFDGCKSLMVQSNVDEPNNLIIVQQWQSRAHYDKYLGWRTESGGMGTMKSMLAGAPSVRYYDMVDV